MEAVCALSGIWKNWEKEKRMNRERLRESERQFLNPLWPWVGKHQFEKQRVKREEGSGIHLDHIELDRRIQERERGRRYDSGIWRRESHGKIKKKWG